MKYYIDAFINYLNLDGRASRKDFWMFTLFHYIFSVVFMSVDILFGWYPETLPIRYGYSYFVYILLSALPCICIQVRRLHDVGKSGSWWLIEGVPVLSLYLFYLNCKAGDPESNQYGFPSNYTPHSKPYKSRFTECPKCRYIAVFEKECPKCGFILPTEVKEDNTSESSKILYCRKCGTKLLEGSKFCKECGTQTITKVNESPKSSQ